MRRIWQWLSRIMRADEANQRRLADFIERRRRELVQRAARRIGIY